MKCWNVFLSVVVLALFCGACSGEPAAEGGGDVDREIDTAHEAHAEVLAVSIEMAAADLKELYTRDVYSREQVAATVSLGADDDYLDVMGLRFRGATTRLYPKKGFSIRLDERPELEAFPGFNFRGEKRDAGNRVLLNALWTDPTGMRETLSFGMYRKLGLPAMQTYYADVTINGNFEGFYLGMERVDREFLKGQGLHRKQGEFTMVRDQGNRRFDEIPNNRSMFGFDIDSILNTDEERIELLQEAFDYRGEVEDTNWEGLLELIRWARATPAGAQWAEEFEERFDVDGFIDYVAIHVLTHDRDSMDIDFWMYRDESADAEDGCWKFFPWDKNLTFGTHFLRKYFGHNDFFDYDNGFLNTYGNAFADKLLQTPALRNRLNVRLRELMEETFTVAYFEEKIAALKPIVQPSMERAPGKNAYVLHPRQHYTEAGFLDEHLARLIDFVELRYAYVGRQIDKVSGEAYEAELEILDGKAGDVVFLTDAKGWVIARMALREGVAEATVSARVEEKEGLAGIDRIWSFEVDGDDVVGDLSLYYRNTPTENWYGEEEAVGRQRELVMKRVEGGDGLEALETRVNPYSNRVEANVRLEGAERFVVVY